MRWSILASGVIAVSLSGCAAYKQQQAERAAAERAARLKQAVDNATQECTVLYSNAAIDPIRPRIAIQHLEDATLIQMSDQARASAADLPAIDAFETARRKCATIYLSAAMSNLPSEHVHALERAQSRAWDLSKDLYARRITFGEFNTGRAEAQRQLNADMLVADERLRERAIEIQRQADERERERQSRSLAILGAVAAARPSPTPTVPYVPMQLPAYAPVPAVSKPLTITNCNQFGSNINCTTY